PAELPGAGAEVLEALRVSDDLGCIERVPHVFDEAGARTGRWTGPCQDRSRLDAIRFLAREHASENRFSDPGERNAQLERRLAGPPPGALLLRLVIDGIDKCGATI